MMNVKKLILILTVSLAISACSPSRHEMPITTSSEEARELFLEGREISENGETGRADTFFIKAIELDPDFALAHLWLRLQDGVPKAKKLIDNVSKGEALMIRAYEAYLTGVFLISDQATDSLIALYPKDKHCLYFASLVFYNRDTSKTIEYLTKAIKIDRYYTAPYNLLGYQMMELKRYKEAEAAFLQYLDMYPNSGNTNDSYAEMLMITGREEESIKFYQRVVMLEPSYSYIYVKLAWIFIRQGNFEEAKKNIDILYDLNKRPDDKLMAISMMANIKFINGDLLGALDIMDQLIQKNDSVNNISGVIRAMHLKGWYAMFGGRPDLALDIFIQGLSMIENTSVEMKDKLSRSMWLHGSLSLLYGGLGEMETAEQHLNQARFIYQNNDNTTADKNFYGAYEAGYAINQGNYELAVEKVKLLADRTSITPKYYAALANDLLGKRDQAVEYYKMVCIDFNPYFTGFFFNKSKKRLKELAD